MRQPVAIRSRPSPVSADVAVHRCQGGDGIVPSAGPFAAGQLLAEPTGVITYLLCGQSAVTLAWVEAARIPAALTLDDEIDVAEVGWIYPGRCHPVGMGAGR